MVVFKFLQSIKLYFEAILILKKSLFTKNDIYLKTV